MKDITYKLELNNRPSANGKYALMLRLTQNRSHRRIKLGFEIDRKYWKSFSDRKGFYLSRSCSEYALIMRTVDNKVYDAKTHAIEQKGFTSNINIVKALKGQDKYKFFEFADIIMDRLDSSEQIATYNRYKGKMEKLKKYVHNRKLHFEEITVGFINDYIAYLKTLGNTKTTIYEGDLKTIKAVFNQAIREDIIPYDQNPFLKIKMVYTPSTKTKLTAEEMSKIEKAELEIGSAMWHVRNYFLFSFYAAGIRFRDLCQLRWDNIEDGRIAYRMRKNDKIRSVKLIEPLQRILELYKEDHPSSGYVFPLLTEENLSAKEIYYKSGSQNTKVNKQLKRIAKKVDIDKHVTFHISRHSFSDILRKRSNDIHAIKNLLGHSSIRTTERYLNSLDDERQDEVHGLIWVEIPE